MRVRHADDRTVPCIRRDDPVEVFSNHTNGLFPAYAGMIPDMTLMLPFRKPVPCIRRDDPEARRCRKYSLDCSLHTQG